MKKLIYSLLIAGLVWSCNSESKTDNPTPTAVNTLDLSLYAPLDLTPYQIPTSLYLPNDEQLVGGAVEPEIIHEEDDFSWTIKASRAFELHIEDYGERDALALYKENMGRYDDIHNYEILEDSAQVLVYKQSLKKESTTSVEHYSYHCVGMFTADGINYLISSRKAGYEKPIINVMRTTIAEIARRSEKSAV
ncbi:hypothetical protein SAMN05216474_3123 [Lishizhenia tianjinensis]|uniref:Gliding motility-associated lipoprotein GldD n=1 Tax=Lishizhenia tianjinensis TaxID=477690 RepID=A0A1I7BVQ1_9FLAO|nr:hypothetical protein [Lishizhenia tianjinensis]SFT91286.1 hypothetical protein SAMN05216474_3123 [Lishizhenia tianjinensis]